MARPTESRRAKESVIAESIKMEIAVLAAEDGTVQEGGQVRSGHEHPFAACYNEV